MKVVAGRSTPFQRTLAPDANPVPVTVSGVSGLPAVTLLGFNPFELIVGPPVMVKATELDI